MGVVKEEISPGNGVDFPKKGDYVTMLYVGTLIDGSVFDSTIKRGPFTTLIGVGRVIQGWDEAILEMSLGEKAKLKITADYAYGARGFGDIIPANSDLIFEVELIKINDKEVCPTTTTTTTTTAAK